MKNVELDVKGNILTIKVDLSKTFGESKSGKSITVASTLGNTPLKGDHDGIFVGLNVYKTTGK